MWTRLNGSYPLEISHLVRCPGVLWPSHDRRAVWLALQVLASERFFLSLSVSLLVTFRSGSFCSTDFPLSFSPRMVSDGRKAALAKERREREGGMKGARARTHMGHHAGHESWCLTSVAKILHPYWVRLSCLTSYLTIASHFEIGLTPKHHSCSRS